MYIYKKHRVLASVPFSSHASVHPWQVESLQVGSTGLRETCADEEVGTPNARARLAAKSKNLYKRRIRRDIVKHIFLQSFIHIL
jgi:hypothetical protein